MKTLISAIQPPVFSYPFQQNLTEIAFFDIETTGLSPKASSLYLIGIMYYNAENKEWELCQWFANNYESEKEILCSFLDKLSDFSYLYHFNGQTFDIPYVLKKCAHHSIPLNEHCTHIFTDTTGCYSIDLLKKIRPLKKALGLTRCNQTSLEQWLGIQRKDTFQGGELIQVYSSYMQQRILQPQEAQHTENILLLHNHDDIKMMLHICSMLLYCDLLSENAAFLLPSDTSCTTMLPEPFQAVSAKSLENQTEDSANTDYQTLCLSFPLAHAVPKEVTLTAWYPPNPAFSFLPPATLHLKRDMAKLTLPVIKATLKFFFDNPKEYYYLPKEDTAIHKSVAEFVDPAYRQKATKATCYIRKEGFYLPSLVAQKRKKKEACNTNFSNLFYHNYQDKLGFYALPKQNESESDFWYPFLLQELPCFKE